MSDFDPGLERHPGEVLTEYVARLERCVAGLRRGQAAATTDRPRGLPLERAKAAVAALSAGDMGQLALWLEQLQPPAGADG